MTLERTQEVAVFRSFPQVAALGARRLQELCNLWVATPLAKECTVRRLIVVDATPAPLLRLIVAPTHQITHGETLFFPMDHLLTFIIRNEWPEGDEQERLLETLMAKRQKGGPDVYQRFVFNLGGEGAVEQEIAEAHFVVNNIAIRMVGPLLITLRPDPHSDLQIIRFRGAITPEVIHAFQNGTRGYLSLMRPVKEGVQKTIFRSATVFQTQMDFQEGLHQVEFLVNDEADGPFEAERIQLESIRLPPGMKPLRWSVKIIRYTRLVDPIQRIVLYGIMAPPNLDTRLRIAGSEWRLTITGAESNSRPPPPESVARLASAVDYGWESAVSLNLAVAL